MQRRRLNLLTQTLLQMINKDGRDVAIEQLTPETYLVPKGEERLYHCIIEVRNFSRTTGQKLSHPRIQKFNRKIWERSVRDNLLKQGYTVTVLWNPNEWIKAHAEQKAQAVAMSKAAKEAEIQAKINDAVAKAVAEALAAQKAAKPAKKASGKKTDKPAEGEVSE